MNENKSLSTQLSKLGVEPVVYRAMQDLHPGANADSLMMILRYCQASKLDPLRSPVVILPIDGHNVPVLSINGLRAHACRTGAYAGSRIEYADESADAGGLRLPTWCKCTVDRILSDGTRASFDGLVFAAEAVSMTRAGKPTPIWQKRGMHMLAIAAERLALRRGFPESIPPTDVLPERQQYNPDTGEIHGPAPQHLSDADIAAGLDHIEGHDAGADEWLDDYDQAATR